MHLPPHWHHTHYDSIASTMLCCDPQTVEAGECLLITADEQTAGRGQRDTVWESERGKNLTFNIGWHGIPAFSAEIRKKDADISPVDYWPKANEQFLISEVIALSILYTLQDYLSFPSTPKGSPSLAIKWPNDIYYGDRKICGMLLEHRLSGTLITSSIIGIGINVNQMTFATPPKFSAHHIDSHGYALPASSRNLGDGAGLQGPVSLAQILGNEVDRWELLEHFIQHLEAGLSQLRAGDFDSIETAYHSHLYRQCGFHPFRDAEGDFLARFVNVARNGLLTLQQQEGLSRTYAFKEVAYL